MARLGEFDEAEVVERATDAFRRLGYGGASVGALEASTGLSRISIYNAFGDEEGLFLRALDRYRESVAPTFEDVVAPGGLRAVERFFLDLSGAVDADSPRRRGCLMVNTVLDARGPSDAVQARVEGYRAMLRDGFLAALRGAVSSGEMRARGAVLNDRADFLLAAQWGALAVVRLHGDPPAARPACRVVASTVRGWRKT